MSCQNERSQHKNRASAMKVLKARLYDLRLKEQQAKLDQLGGEKKDIAFGSQIRSYVLHPYQMVKDHRTKFQVGDVNRVLDGDLDEFIKAYLMKKALGKLETTTSRTTSAPLSWHDRFGAGDEDFGPRRRLDDDDVARALEVRRLAELRARRRSTHVFMISIQIGSATRRCRSACRRSALLVEADPDADRDVADRSRRTTRRSSRRSCPSCRRAAS